MSSHQNIPSFSVKELFASSDQYIIPVYQRNYSWGMGEVKQLIQDIYDYASNEKKSSTPYYIGTLVVFERHEDENLYYETIDGQQRLTTLTLIMNAMQRWCNNEIKDEFRSRMKLKFFSRPKSEETLSVIQRDLNEPVNFINTVDYEIAIKERYLDTEKVLRELLGEPKNAIGFFDYLKNKVHLVRVSVPPDTDLNHYFEIMNNRGEQLEKHEVLKSQLMSYFKDDISGMFSFQKAWDAVEDMERYVQYGFSIKERDALFGAKNWNELKAKNFASFKKLLSFQIGKNPMAVLEIEEIVNHKSEFGKNEDHKEDAPERFNSVINFQGFLLQVLRVFTQKDIPLDDKQLIDTFKLNLNTKELIEDYSFALLKCKYLFDKYVIKRESLGDRDQWSLKHLKRYDNNKVSYVNSFGDAEQQDSIKMLLSMFHVTLPSMNYKHWLSASLNYLYKQKSDFDPNDYKTNLFMTAQAYFYDRILSPGEPLDYFEMIFKDAYKTAQVKLEDLAWDNLKQGTSVENFAFNFTDYLLWEKSKKPAFDFSFRSSVEHYYPQNPIDGVKLDDIEVLNSFGNLCLISSSKNSRLSNYLPMAKKDHYKSVSTESLKLKRMMDLTSEESSWDKTAIKLHQKEIFKILRNNYEKNAK